jgi:hypothetical protein
MSAARSRVDSFLAPHCPLSGGTSPSGRRTTAPAHSEPNVVKSPNVSRGDTPANCAIAIKTGPSGRRFAKKSSARSSREPVGDPSGSETDKTRLPSPHRSMPLCSHSKAMRLLGSGVKDKTGVPYSQATRRSTTLGLSSNYYFVAKESKQSKGVVERRTELSRFEVRKIGLAHSFPLSGFPLAHVVLGAEVPECRTQILWHRDPVLTALKYSHRVIIS